MLDVLVHTIQTWIYICFITDIKHSIYKYRTKIFTMFGYNCHWPNEECSPMVRETGVQSQSESYQKLKKVLDVALHYKVRMKGKVEQSMKWSSIFPYILVWWLVKRKPLVHPRLPLPTLLYNLGKKRHQCWTLYYFILFAQLLRPLKYVEMDKRPNL